MRADGQGQRQSWKAVSGKTQASTVRITGLVTRPDADGTSQPRPSATERRASLADLSRSRCLPSLLVFVWMTDWVLPSISTPCCPHPRRRARARAARPSRSCLHARQAQRSSAAAQSSAADAVQHSQFHDSAHPHGRDRNASPQRHNCSRVSIARTQLVVVLWRELCRSQFSRHGAGAFQSLSQIVAVEETLHVERLLLHALIGVILTGTVKISGRWTAVSSGAGQPCHSQTRHSSTGVSLIVPLPLCLPPLFSPLCV